ncbi:hypothetical protein KXW64_008468 [Aspergillus fumigatus]|nr:hypothetical protein KXW64_008468 [Aspergillus fumigatus]
MGCDIHPVLEKKVKFEDGTEKWVGLHDFEMFPSFKFDKETNRVKRDGWAERPAFDGRNYSRFAALAGVRGEGPDAKGYPNDASDMAKYLSERYGEDGHSHSWCSLREALEISLKTEFDSARVFLDPEDDRAKAPIAYFFGMEFYDDEDNMDNYRVLFFFDN